jgi:hypothetical protein
MSLTIAEVSAIDFEPWTEEDGTEMPLKPKEWLEMLITVRIAWAVMFRSKPELVKGIGSSEDAFMEAMEVIGNVKDFLKDLTEMLGVAEMRLLASAAAHCEARQRDA